MPLLIFAIIFILFVTVLLLFSSPSLSPVPYFPTNHKDLDMILNHLQLDVNQIVFDLGAGDGVILLEAARKAYKERLNTKFIGVEINPILVFIIFVRAFFHPNRKNIKVIWGDMFKIDYNKFVPNSFFESVFYLYISPWHIEKTLHQIQKSKNPTRIVSYMYAVKPLEQIEKSEKGLHRVFSYNLSDLNP